MPPDDQAWESGSWASHRNEVLKSVGKLDDIARSLQHIELSVAVMQTKIALSTALIALIVTGAVEFTVRVIMGK